MTLDKTSIVTPDFATPMSPFTEYPYTCKLVYKQFYMVLQHSHNKMGNGHLRSTGELSNPHICTEFM